MAVFSWGRLDFNRCSAAKMPAVRDGDFKRFGTKRQSRPKYLFSVDFYFYPVWSRSRSITSQTETKLQTALSCRRRFRFDFNGKVLF